MDIKIIADPIHGMMIFESYLVKIINHPYFQRLRHIKQMQGVEHVYPGGVHTRFSHSLGVCFLAGKVLDKLKNEPGISISDFDRKCVTISALCHDIGHGPYSHLYENISKEIDDNPCEHEARGMEITRKIIDDLELFDAEERESAKTIIGNMIKGKLVEDMTEEERKKAYLYQIVNNENNGIDVDKWDYFIRDSHACGFPSNFDTERAISGLKVSRYHKKYTDIKASVLSFPFKDQINLYNMFNTRFTLYNKVCKHPVVKCVEEMIADVLKLADNTKLLELEGNSVSTKDCRGVGAIANYCLMDDRIVYLIDNANVNCPALDGTANNANNLKLAKSIIKRIRRRDFYRCIYKEGLDYTPEQVEKILEDKKDIEKRIESKIVQHLNSKEEKPAFTTMLNEIRRLENERLTENIGGVFRISIVKVNYGNKDKNPIPNVYFYDKGGDSVIEYQLPEKSPMVPQCFEEVTIRVMCTLGKQHCNGILLENEFKPQIDSVLAEFARLTKKRKLPIWS